MLCRSLILYRRVVVAPMPRPTPIGTYLSFQLDIVPADAKPDEVPKSSPRSEWIQFLDPRTHSRLVTGDGFAAVETKRHIYALPFP